MLMLPLEILNEFFDEKHSDQVPAKLVQKH